MTGFLFGEKFVSPGDAVLAVAEGAGGVRGTVIFSGALGVCGFGAGVADHAEDDTGMGRAGWVMNSLLIMSRVTTALRVRKE